MTMKTTLAFIFFIFAIYLFGPAGLTLGMALWTAVILWLKMMIGGFVLLLIGVIGIKCVE